MNKIDNIRFRKVLNRIGLTPTEAFNMFAKRTAETGSIPFSASAPNSKLQKILKSKSYVKFNNADQGLKWLNE